MLMLLPWDSMFPAADLNRGAMCVCVNRAVWEKVYTIDPEKEGGGGARESWKEKEHALTPRKAKF